VKANTSARALAVFMVGAGGLHFVLTDGYARIVPHFIPGAELVVRVSGVAEIICGCLVAIPRTRRIGGFATAALLVAVFPANVQMALDGGLHGAGFPLGNAVVAWLRLPVQLPLIKWALSVARR
jgi:uncharacterized membrane protein